jgi:pyruvate dehydrogenase E2 component (dihydrolipoamide acetyltransferase)
MPTPILMPALSPTMEEGTLAKWHVREGDTVAPGDLIAEIETDKATMEVEAVDEGQIGKLLVAEGTQHVPVNQPIALLLTEDDAAAPFTSPPGEELAAPSAPGEGVMADSPSPSPQPSPQRGEDAAMPRIPFPSPLGGEGVPTRSGEAGSHGGKGEGVQAPADSTSPSPQRGEGDRLFASPLARRLARERGLDLGKISGSGPHGRIVMADIERAVVEEPAEVAVEPEVTVEAMREPRGMVRHPAAQRMAQGLGQAMSDESVRAMYEPGSYALVPHDTMRRFIAERLTLAKQTIPHFYLSIDCKLDALAAARKRLNGIAPKDGPHAFRLSVNDFIIKAMAMALQAVPGANATWTSEGLLLHRNSDVAVAVALPGGGLFTPVIRNAEVKSLSEISNEMKDLAARARSKRLAPHEYQGGSTTISNLGMYGIAHFEAVINPPQASILAVGKAQKRPVIKKDTVKIATMMSVTLSVDHRVIDGALGAELLAAFKAFIQDPVTMLV